MDPRSLIIGSSLGGKAVAEKVETLARRNKKSVYEYDSRQVGNVRILLDRHRSIILDSTRRL